MRLQPVPRAQGGVSAAGARGRGLVLARSSADASPVDAVGRWWNETVEFFDALELTGGLPMQNDTAPEAVALNIQLDLINATLAGDRGSAASQQTSRPATPQKTQLELAALMEPLGGLTLAYYRMRLERTMSKKPVKRGLSSSVLYANLAFAAVFFRVLGPRLLAAGSMDEIFDAASAVGIPDRATLASMLEYVQNYDASVKVALYALAFILEKLTLLSDVLPLQIALKTVAPVLFGGLWQGALASAVFETLGAACNFAIGRAFFADRLREVSIFGGQPIGKASWYKAVARAADTDGLRLVLLLRLAPVLPLPFDSYWYLLGALPVRFEEFAVAHFLGCLKTAFLDASFGMLLLTSVAQNVQEQAQQIVLSETVGFAVAAVLIGTVASRLANDLLELDKDDPEEPEPSQLKLEDPPEPPEPVQPKPCHASTAPENLARRVD